MPGTFPTPTKTWDFGTSNADINESVTANAAGLTLARPILRKVKDRLKGKANHPIAIKGSSDSVTAAMDGTDRWAADANLVWVQTSGVHSWIVWDHDAINDGSGHKLQVCLDLTGGGVTSGDRFQAFASPVSGFTGGTTSARPTATDEVPLGSTTSITFATASAVHRTHVISSTDGLVYHIVIATGNNPNFHMCIAAPTPTIDAVPTVPGWSYPWLISLVGASAGNNLTAANMVSSYSARFSSRHSATTLVCGLEVEGGTALIKAGGAGVAANGVTGQLPILGHGIWSTTGGGLGRLGYVPDLYFVSDTAFATIGSTIGSDDNHRRWMVAGCALLPWTNDGTIPLGG